MFRKHRKCCIVYCWLHTTNTKHNHNEIEKFQDIFMSNVKKKVSIIHLAQVSAEFAISNSDTLILMPQIQTLLIYTISTGVISLDFFFILQRGNESRIFQSNLFHFPIELEIDFIWDRLDLLWKCQEIAK